MADVGEALRTRLEEALRTPSPKRRKGRARLLTASPRRPPASAPRPVNQLLAELRSLSNEQIVLLLRQWPMGLQMREYLDQSNWPKVRMWFPAQWDAPSRLRSAMKKQLEQRFGHMV